MNNCIRRFWLRIVDCIESSWLRFKAAVSPKKKEPIASECSLEGWPEIELNDPTRAYYEEVFPPGQRVVEFLKEEYKVMLQEKNKNRVFESRVIPVRS